MNRLLSFSTLALVLTMTLPARSQGVEVDVAAFRADSGKSFIEVHFGVLQRLLIFKEAGPKWVAPLKAKIEILQNGQVVDSKLVEREVTVVGGKAEVEAASVQKVLHGAAFTVPQSDKNEVRVHWTYERNGKDTTEVIRREVVAPKVDAARLGIGGIELASEMKKADETGNPFEKFGYILMPNPSGVFGGLYTKLAFYTEIYVPQSMVDETQSIEVITRVRDGRGHEYISTTKKQPLYGMVIPYIGTADIDALPGDAYTLEIVLKRADAIEAVGKKSFWFESDISFSEESDTAPMDEQTLMTLSGIPSLTELELEDRLAQSMYLGNDADKKTIKSLKDSDSKKKFLFNFWRRQDLPSAAPLGRYRDFVERLAYVNKKFTYQKTPGWKTARGRIYLTYGSPDALTEELFVTDAKPYIIWEYYNKEIRIQSGTRPQFVFLDKQGGGQFILIHSNVQGEVSQPNWYRTEARRTQ